MNTLIKITLCVLALFALSSCKSNKEEHMPKITSSPNSTLPFKTNGEIKDILEEKGWKGKCSVDHCYIENGKTQIIKAGDYSEVKKSTSLSNDEINSYLDWMEIKKDNDQLQDDEWASKKDKEATEKLKTENETTENDNSESVKQSTSKAQESLSTGKRNALKSAKLYLDTTAFSYSGLIEQLEYEKYTTEEATYAADNCDADWNEQAAKSEKNYLDTMAFSKQDLIDQLIYEGFTQAQAEYGVSKAGY